MFLKIFLKKHHWKKMVEIAQERDFLNSKFCKKSETVY